MFYLRIFTERTFKIIACSLIIVCVQYGVSTAIAIVFGCRPISAAWESALEEYSCIDKLALYYANTGLSIFIDFLTFVLPLWVSSNKGPTLEKAFLICYLIIIVRSCSGFSSLGNRDRRSRNLDGWDSVCIHQSPFTHINLVTTPRDCVMSIARITTTPGMRGDHD